MIFEEKDERDQVQSDSNDSIRNETKNLKGPKIRVSNMWQKFDRLNDDESLSLKINDSLLE